jgi:hypothetical protein
MNIFILDYDQDANVRAYVDKHVIKMVTEYAQMLSTAVRLTTGLDVGYKVTHQNHRCSVWTRESLSNWLWLRDLTEKLNGEYRYRYQKDVDIMSCLVARDLPLPNIEDRGLTPFPLAMPDVCKVDDAVQSYRNYYIIKKQHIASWKRRPDPEWFVRSL